MEQRLLTASSRLEAATSRLEDMVPSVIDGSATQDGHASSKVQGLGINDQSRGPSSPPQQQSETLPASVEDFDAMINSVVKTYVNVSEELGGLVAEQVRFSQKILGLDLSDEGVSSQQPCYVPLRQNASFS